MITIKYSPHGQRMSDWHGKEVVKNIKEYIKDQSSPTIHIANEIIILAIRVAVKKQEISHKDICFQFENQIIEISKDGGFYFTPNGFCDMFDNYLNILLEI